MGTWDGQKDWLFGGISLSTELSTFDPVALAWTTVLPATAAGSPPGRIYGGFCYGGGLLWLFGGMGQTTLLNDLWSFDPKTTTWTQRSALGAASAPASRERMGMVWDGQHVIVFGGVVGGNNETDLWWFDPTTNAWTLKIADAAPGSPQIEAARAFVWDGNRVLTWSGDATNTTMSTAYFYDPATNAWTSAAISGACPGGVYDGGAVWDGNEAILYYPHNYNNTFTAETWQYNVGNNQWTKTFANADTRAVEPRMVMTLAQCGDGMLFFGGQMSSLPDPNDVWLYKPGAAVSPQVGPVHDCFVSMASQVKVNTPFSAVVTLADFWGNVVTTAGGFVTVQLDASLPGTTFSGTLQQPVVNGVATFSDLEVDVAGFGDQVQAHWNNGTLGGDGPTLTTVP